MWKPILFFALLLAGLVIWDGRLTARETTERETSKRVGRLIPSDRKAEIEERFRCIEVQRGGQSHIYLRAGGLWRCLSWFAAPVNTGAANSVVQKLLAAEGVVQSEDPALFGEYGIGVDRTVRVVFHGENAVRQSPQGLVFDGDEIYAVDIGDPIPGHDGCYAHQPGGGPAERSVWAVDANPMGELAPGPHGSPPLLDAHVVPAAWPGEEGGRVGRIEVLRPGERYSMELRDRPVTEEEMRQGKSPFEWIVQHGAGVEEKGEEGLTMAFSFFLHRSPWLGFIGPEQAAAVGLDPPAAQVVLHPTEGDPLTISVGSPQADGTTAIHNPHTRCVYRVETEVAQLMVPELIRMMPGATENPWEPYLRTQH